VRGLQKPELHVHQEPEEASGPAGDEEVLPVVPETYPAQRSEVTSGKRQIKGWSREKKIRLIQEFVRRGGDKPLASLREARGKGE